VELSETVLTGEEPDSALASPEYSADNLAGPEEDPGDLFEPLPVGTQLVAPPPAPAALPAMASAEIELPAPVEPQPAEAIAPAIVADATIEAPHTQIQTLEVATAPVVAAVAASEARPLAETAPALARTAPASAPRAPARPDPLAAVRALSEEELIALFS
jgi:hypothetical protein